MIDAEVYWRSRLSVDGQRTYDSLCSALQEGRNEASAFTFDNNVLQRCISAVILDKPQYFWLSSKTFITSSRNMVCIKFSNIYRPNEIKSAVAEINRVTKLVHGADDLETEKKIAEYLVRNVNYHIDNKYNQNMASAIYFKKAQCSGFASAVKYLCDVNGIWCIRVDGELYGNQNGPHAWNIVCLGGKYYHLDVTAMAGLNSDKPSHIRYSYFNLNDAEIATDHKWDISSVPCCSERFNHKPTGSGNCDDIVIFSNLAEMRNGIENAMKCHKTEYSFILKVGDNANEKQKLVTSGINMVMKKLQYCGSVQLEILGDTVTIKLNG